MKIIFFVREIIFLNVLFAQEKGNYLKMRDYSSNGELQLQSSFCNWIQFLLFSEQNLERFFSVLCINWEQTFILKILCQYSFSLYPDLCQMLSRCQALLSFLTENLSWIIRNINQTLTNIIHYLSFYLSLSRENLNVE